MAERSNRRVVVLGGVAAALILGVLVLPGLLFGGGGTPTNPFPPPSPNATSTTTPGEGPAAETFEAFTSKNPFHPLVSSGSAPSDSGQGTSTPVVIGTTSATFPPEAVLLPDSGSGAPTDSGSGPPTAGGGGTATTQPAPPPRQPDRVSLLEVYTDRSGRALASMRVNDTSYQVGEGQEFATSYRVLNLDTTTRCAQLLFGDERFRLCEGEETLK